MLEGQWIYILGSCCFWIKEVSNRKKENKLGLSTHYTTHSWWHIQYKSITPIVIGVSMGWILITLLAISHCRDHLEFLHNLPLQTTSEFYIKYWCAECRTRKVNTHSTKYFTMYINMKLEKWNKFIGRLVAEVQTYQRKLSFCGEPSLRGCHSNQMGKHQPDELEHAKEDAMPTNKVTYTRINKAQTHCIYSTN